MGETCLKTLAGKIEITGALLVKSGDRKSVV